MRYLLGFYKKGFYFLIKLICIECNLKKEDKGY